MGDSVRILLLATNVTVPPGLQVRECLLLISCSVPCSLRWKKIIAWIGHKVENVHFVLVSGINCSIDIAECDIDPCLFGGTCTEPVPNDYLCICPPGIEGRNCQNVFTATFGGQQTLVVNFPTNGANNQRRKRQALGGLEINLSFQTTVKNGVILFAKEVCWSKQSAVTRQREWPSFLQFKFSNTAVPSLDWQPGKTPTFGNSVGGWFSCRHNWCGCGDAEGITSCAGVPDNVHCGCVTPYHERPGDPQAESRHL